MRPTTLLPCTAAFLCVTAYGGLHSLGPGSSTGSLASTVAPTAVTWYVDDDAPGDPAPGDPNASDPAEDGSAAHPFDTIQEAIDAASNGHLVEVADGTYTSSSDPHNDFSGKAITVYSASGDPDLCVVDGGNDGAGFAFQNGEGADSVLTGITITNARSWSGGGVFCYHCSPTLTNCVITGNSAVDSSPDAGGGGLMCMYANPTLTGCVISGNSATSCGGGVLCLGADAVFIDCDVTGNSAYDGGGIWCDNSSPNLTGCLISDNLAEHCAGMRCGYRYPTLTDCTISGNIAAVNGGGICCSYGAPTLTDCTIQGNSAANAGGGMHCADGSQPTLNNCTVADNSILGNAAYGGGVYCEGGSSPTLANCNIAGNLASAARQAIGGGLFCVSDATLVNCLIQQNSAVCELLGARGGGLFCAGTGNHRVVNCVIYDNTASAPELVEGGGVRCSSDATFANFIRSNTPDEFHVSSGTPDVTFCNINSGAGQPWFGTGCIDSDPLFVDPNGPDGDPTTWADNDFNLSSTSPCIDAGDSTAVPRDSRDLDADGCTSDRILRDLAGNYRFSDDSTTPDSGIATYWRPVVDMGTFEYGSTTSTPFEPCFGDLNCDGVADIFDIDPFVMALVAPEDYANTYPGCAAINADCNEDGAADIFDITSFVALITEN